MILDRQNLMSYKQAITTSAPSTDIIDLGPNHWVGYSGTDRGLPLVIAIDEVFAAAGAATLQVEIQSSNAANFGSGVVTHSSHTFTKGELVQSGKVSHAMHCPADCKRYIRANYTVGTGPFTAGKLTLGFVASRQINA